MAFELLWISFVLCSCVHIPMSTSSNSLCHVHVSLFKWPSSCCHIHVPSVMVSCSCIHVQVPIPVFLSDAPWCCLHPHDPFTHFRVPMFMCACACSHCMSACSCAHVHVSMPMCSRSCFHCHGSMFATMFPCSWIHVPYSGFQDSFRCSHGIHACVPSPCLKSFPCSKVHLSYFVFIVVMLTCSAFLFMSPCSRHRGPICLLMWSCTCWHVPMFVFQCWYNHVRVSHVRVRCVYVSMSMCSNVFMCSNPGLWVHVPIFIILRFMFLFSCLC